MNTLEQTTALEKRRANAINERLRNSVKFLNETYPKTLETNIKWHDLFKMPDPVQSGKEREIELETVKKILNIISDKFSVDIEGITPKTSFEQDLDASEDDIADVISEVCDSLNAKTSDNPEDYTFVDDLLEAITGNSYWNSFTGDNDIIDEEYELERFCSFYQSYINGEYTNKHIDSFTQMFDEEGRLCKSQAVMSQFYCVAAAERLNHFLIEWIDNAFSNYRRNKDLVEFVKKLEKGLEEISICCKIIPDDKEFIIIRQTLQMLKDYWIDSNTDYSHYVETYGKMENEEYKQTSNYMFNMKWLTSMFKVTYNKILSLCDE